MQEFTAKREKLWTEFTEVEKPRIFKKSAAQHQGDIKNEIQHSHPVSQVTSKLEISTTDDSFSQSLQQRDSVKPKVTCDEKLSKRDAADMVVRQLTPYYKSNRFGSKVRTFVIYKLI